MITLLFGFADKKYPINNELSTMKTVAIGDLSFCYQKAIAVMNTSPLNIQRGKSPPPYTPLQKIRS